MDPGQMFLRRWNLLPCSASWSHTRNKDFKHLNPGVRHIPVPSLTLIFLYWVATDTFLIIYRPPSCISKAGMQKIKYVEYQSVWKSNCSKKINPGDLGELSTVPGMCQCLMVMFYLLLSAIVLSSPWRAICLSWLPLSCISQVPTEQDSACCSYGMLIPSSQSPLVLPLPLAEPK